jgi:putative colanic acid biosysnthesis UDP-glucose lipid carrier transferase
VRTAAELRFQIAATGRIEMLGQWKLNDLNRGATAAEPSSVFVFKSLYSPIVAVGSLVFFASYWGEPFGGPYVLVAVLAFFGAADFLEIAQAPQGGVRLSAIRSLIEITLRWAVISGFIFGLLYLSRIAAYLDDNVLLSWALATPIFLWAGEIVLLRLGLSRIPTRRAVVVGMTDLGLRLVDKLQEDALLRTDVLGFFEDRSPARLPANSTRRVLGKSADLFDFVIANHINVVYITLPMNRDSRIVRLLDALLDSTVSIYFVPDVFVFNLIQPRFDVVSGIPVVAVRESPFYGMNGATKRLVDIALASAAIIALSPVWLFVAAGVGLGSKGPVIFKQRRYGLDGKEIVVYKFRSMSVLEDGDKSYTQVSRNDVRVTPFGSFIRKTSLDELPQLLNVLEGSMSIVGPRPHAVAVNEQYRRLIPSYMVRHKVKPGITGWAQVNGYRGGDDLESMTKRISCDLDYLNNWSLRLDILIMIKTAALIWSDSRAY